MTRKTSASWTLEMIDMFATMFPAHDYPAIQREMNKRFPGRHFTRSAICGHAFRNGFKKGKRSARKPVAKAGGKMNLHQHTVRKVNAKKKQNAELAAQVEALGLDEVEMAEGQTLMNQPCWRGTLDKSVGLHSLDEDSCRWPLEVDGCDELRFCSNRKGRGAYCLAHASISYASPRVRAPRDDKPHYRASGLSTGQWGR